jgi:hypothetical protein
VLVVVDPAGPEVLRVVEDVDAEVAQPVLGLRCAGYGLRPERGRAATAAQQLDRQEDEDAHEAEAAARARQRDRAGGALVDDIRVVGAAAPAHGLRLSAPR